MTARGGRLAPGPDRAQDGNVRRVVGEDTAIRRSPRVVHRELADGAGGVLLHLDTADYHGLNPVGTLVWTLLEDAPTFSKLLVELRTRFDTIPPSFEDEIRMFLNELRERGLVEYDE